MKLPANVSLSRPCATKCQIACTERHSTIQTKANNVFIVRQKLHEVQTLSTPTRGCIMFRIQTRLPDFAVATTIQKILTQWHTQIEGFLGFIGSFGPDDGDGLGGSCSVERRWAQKGLVEVAIPQICTSRCSLFTGHSNQQAHHWLKHSRNNGVC